MANILTENFTGSDSTQINGFNSWVANSTGLQIQSNKAAKTDNGSVWAYKSASGWTGQRTASCVWSRYTGAGQRYINYFVLGASDISSQANFLNSGIQIIYARPDSNAMNSSVYVFDGATLVTTNLAGYQFDGSDVTITFTMNSDGSGTAKFDQGANSITLSWSARTWTNGTGQYQGFYMDHSRND